MIGLIIGTLIQLLTLVNNGTPANPSPGNPNGNPTQGGTTTGGTTPTHKPPGGTGSWDDNG